MSHPEPETPRVNSPGMSTVSVVVPSYNHARFVGTAIDSALAQDRAPDEILVVDDGSTDGTREVLERYRGRVAVHLREHAGVVAVYNAATTLASGQFIAFLESDDALEPGYLRAALASLARDPDCRWVSTARRVIDPGGRPTSEIIRKRTPGPRYTTRGFLEHDYGLASTPVVETAALRAMGPWYASRCGLDTDMALRFSVRHAMSFLDEPLYLYRRHGGNASGDVLQNAIESVRHLEMFAAQCPEWVAAHPRVYARAEGKMLGRLGSLLMKEGRASRCDVLDWITRARARDPGSAKHLRRALYARLLYWPARADKGTP
jgi:glycosyltransferase involved in cell wall biosynthesis